MVLGRAELRSELKLSPWTRKRVLQPPDYTRFNSGLGDRPELYDILSGSAEIDIMPALAAMSHD